MENQKELKIKELRKRLIKAMIKKDSRQTFIIKSKIKELQIN
tara:strand:+ start:20167 stop:20292 length:126 start_codon:yes stop_codon:yes gene_type:complete